MSFVLSPNVSRYCFFSIPLETVVIRDTRGSIFYFNKSVLAASTSSLVAQRSGCVCFQTKRIRNVCQVSREFLISGACKAFPGRGIVLIDVWKNNWEVWGRNVKWNVGLLLCCSNMEYEEFWRKFILISDICENFGRNIRVEKCLRKKKFLIWKRIYERIIITFERNMIWGFWRIVGRDNRYL